MSNLFRATSHRDYSECELAHICRSLFRTILSDIPPMAFSDGEGFRRVVHDPGSNTS